MSDYMSLDPFDSCYYTRLRCFDLHKLHSWAAGLVEFPDGRNQQSTSEAVNLILAGSTLASLEMQAAKTWWHVREGDKTYEGGFCKANRVVGVGWANKRDSGLWFTGRDRLECRVGIHVLPLVPITEVLFSDHVFVRSLVEWCLPALKCGEAMEGWKGFVFALEAVYDKESALEHVRSLKGFDDGNSLSNLLCWIHSRCPCK